jgi:2-isopropylmalate synthase
VRILNAGIEGGGTEAVTRVMVESADGKNNRWSTVGVSENIVDASFEALTDSIAYKLLREGAPASDACNIISAASAPSAR